MPRTRTGKIFALLCGFWLFQTHAAVQAASLFGKVISVNSGDVITVFNLNRPVRVKLLGVDAPELDQAFGDVAQKHLADLVYDKSVVVEYSGIAADGSLGGRVLLNDADIGAQMIRDGAAWFDPNTFSRLSERDRLTYHESEQAARSERRGLWQADSPMAPWEFVKAKALRMNPRESLNAIAPARSNRSYSELTNLTLMTRGMSTSDNGFALAERAPGRGSWYEFRPPGENFSALVPQYGKELNTSVPVGGLMADVNVYLARDGWSTYFVQWLKSQSYGETDRAALKDAVFGFSLGLREGFRSPANSACGPSNEKYISIAGHAGVEFDMSSCVLRGRARIVTKVVDGQRQMYVLAVVYMNEDENIPRFLNSLTLDGAPKPKSSKR